MKITITTIDILGSVKRASKRKGASIVLRDSRDRLIPWSRLTEMRRGGLLDLADFNRYTLTVQGADILAAFNLGKRYR
jgi:hypothetical protein